MTKNVKIVELKDINTLDAKEIEGGIVVCDQIPCHQVLSLRIEDKVQHIVQASNFDVDKEIKLSASMITHPIEFIRFPLSHILGDPQPSLESEARLASVSLHLSTPEDKEFALDQVEAFLQKYTNAPSLL